MTTSFPPTGATPAGSSVKVVWHRRLRDRFRALNLFGKILAIVLLIFVIFILLPAILGALIFGAIGVFTMVATGMNNIVDPPDPPIVATQPVETSIVPGPTETVSPPPSSPASSPTSTPTDSPSPSACPVPSEPDRSVRINQFEPASNLTWMADLEEVNRIVYAGVPATAEELRAWVDAAACNGMVAEIRPGKVSDGGQVTATAQGTYCWDEWPATGICSPSEYLPIFHPYPEPNTYGKVSSYAEVGRDATSGVAAVQAFGLWETPTDVKDRYSFPKTGELGNSRPSAEEVGEFARLLHKAGINDILIYHEGGASKDKKYLNEVARAVRKVINQ